MKDYSEYQNKKQELRTPDSIANSIIGKRKHPSFSTITFLLVEGSDDEHFYSTYVNTTSCRVVMTRGKENVQTILSILEKEGQRGILAIVDADFDVLEGKLPATPNHRHK